MKIIKKFKTWIDLKSKLHNVTAKPPFISEGEVWWCSLGENIGSEINGKSELFSRPVLVFKKLSRENFFGIPMTSQIKNGTWYVKIVVGGKESCAILAQARNLSVKRLSTKLYELDEVDMQKIKTGFNSLFLPTFPQKEGRGKSPNVQ